MTSPVSPQRVLFLDYSVLDHMHRIDVGTYIGTYKGTSAAELTALRQAAVAGDIEVWMSRITSVEMVIGLENPTLTSTKLAAANQNDTDKRAIANLMHVRWLTYPASRSDDWGKDSTGYSRIDLTLSSVDPDWPKAKALEDQLLLGVAKKGDAQQVVSCVYGKAEDDGRRPAIRYFVSEDGPLIRTLQGAQAANAVGKLVGLQVRSVKAFVNGMANGQWRRHG